MPFHGGNTGSNPVGDANLYNTVGLVFGDNFAAADEPVYRNLWQHVGRDLLRTRHPLDLPAMLQTALYALYSNYETYYDEWDKHRVGVPPVFIVVCQNTTISRLVYEWIAGFERLPEDG